MRDINHNLIKWVWAAIKIIVIIVAIYFAGVLLFGCNVEKQQARKDISAVARVNANAELQGKVASKWLDAHPLIPTTPEIKYLPGKEITNTITVKDEKELQRVKDSTANAMADTCKNYSLQALDLGYSQAEEYYKKHPFVRVDTFIKQLPPDPREINRWKDTAAKYKQASDTKDGIISELRNQVDTQTKRGNKFIWFFSGSLALLVLSHIARSYIKLPSIKLPKS